MLENLPHWSYNFQYLDFLFFLLRNVMYEILAQHMKNPPYVNYL